MAATLAACYAAHKSGKLKGRVVFNVSTAGETGRHDAAVSIMKALPRAPKTGFIVLGTNSKVALGNKGRIVRTAHGDRCVVTSLATAQELAKVFAESGLLA